MVGVFLENGPSGYSNSKLQIYGGFLVGKIGIITLNGYENYGNRLQNYALEEVLRSFNYDVKTIIIQECIQKEKNRTLNRIRSLGMKDLFRSIKLRTINRTIYNSQKKRLEIFKDFSSKYLNEVKYTISVKEQLNTYYDFAKDYEYFIVGSDQVWNPNFIENENIYFLRFTRKNKRIAYAASFGISELPEKYRENYKNLLNGMEQISVREDAGADIVKDLTGLDVPVHVDPTLLLSKEQWLKITIRAKNKPRNRYLLTYFLGGISNRYVNQIQELAKMNNLAIVNLGDIHEKDTYRTGPSQFLDYISDCSIFCTDSFHGVVFSILFEKPFIVYPREGSISMYSRINTLLDKFDLNNRKVENMKIGEDVFNIDYSNIADIIEKEKNRAINYLKKVLNIKDAN